MKLTKPCTLLALAFQVNAFTRPSFASKSGAPFGAKSGSTQRGLFNLFSSPASDSKYPVYAEESVMSKKAHGTSEKPVQKDLRWNCDFDTADRICNFNRHYAEYAGYWTSTDFLKSIPNEELPIKFYDSVTGELLFTAPVGRTMEEFVKESQSHGWPSFRDEECNWDHVRCLRDGECVSQTGTHLGHNIPDGSGNRYCINLVSVAGQPKED
uniref:MsrB domain-containing protein n=1 Tax=Craspedostauros australis TaxID=1486917 RepID=A0A7S0F676_9STRA|mmetsp:Transcript_8268/g.22416  ORF Transcript_8268/g.22416 Transcript_8268/m.22416 type:complete len:211 (+) Transcript_8268:137-769(+)|eukprot:CAMPEP_0198134088 /NCGR_PEP_ID=MMETSP1442-20131203/59899_1 /TAXON_ID= /ORGANISM="Craspedostauros australis, Strain CCMP3328" /LENGTH=210 /DNA_ID=CAMNT_0043795227 /DNA_START=497 /DNA_END=1129 /DNA_ORIENTATION=+